jgi:hypothetical protein
MRSKLTGRAPFNVGDIQFFYAYLDMPTDEAVEIFFGSEPAYNRLQPRTTELGCKKNAGAARL